MNRKASISDKRNDKINSDVKVESDVHVAKPVDCAEKTSNSQEDSSSNVESKELLSSTSTKVLLKDENTESTIESNKVIKSNDGMPKVTATKNRSKQRESSRELGKRKLGTRITKDSVNESRVKDDIIAEQMDECSHPSLHKELLESGNENMECSTSQEKSKQKLTDDESESSLTKDLSEIDMPEELKSDKKFKEVFQPEGWEELGCDIELPDELTEEKLQTVMEQLSLKNNEPEESSLSWSNWSRNVTSLINTATASVSTLTNHVSQGLTLLEGTIGIQDPIEEVTSEDKKIDGRKYLISF